MAPLTIIIFNFITGSFCIIYGVRQLGTGLERINGALIKRILSIFTKNLPMAFASGTFVTALVQSSTAVTVISVGFVNSGLMTLGQAMGIIYGANLGTTITAQIMSFNIYSICWFAIISGLLLKIFFRRKSLKYAGMALLGIGLMFLGLKILNSGVPYLKESNFTRSIFVNFGNNPYISLLVGMIATMLVHSSSATVGLTIILFNGGLISFPAAVGLMLGDNIGTCITAQTASIGSGPEARQTAWAHTLYNIIGSMLVIPIIHPYCSLVYKITNLLGQDFSRLVANAHTIFNLLSALVFFPFTNIYVKFIKRLIKPKYIKLKAH